MAPENQTTIKILTGLLLRPPQHPALVWMPRPIEIKRQIGVVRKAWIFRALTGSEYLNFVALCRSGRTTLSTVRRVARFHATADRPKT